MKKPESKQRAKGLREKDRKKEQLVWDRFVADEQLDERQAAQFKQFYDLLVAHNQNYNLTALSGALAIVRHHFIDSLMIRQKHDMSTVNGLVDIGTGAGFPAIPLKIIFPELPMVLIEPSKKRQGFLSEIIRVLELKDIQIFDNDWRTFIRTTQGDLNLFVTRAALPVPELARMFKPSSAYKEGTLVYWASAQWKPEKTVAHLVARDEPYRIGSRQRRLIFLQQPKQNVDKQ